MTTLSATVDLPVTEHTVRDARVLVLDLVDSWDSTTCRVDLALLIDDLSSDVVSHADGEHDLRLELTLHEDLLRVSLADGSAVRPAVVDALTGRLRLLAALASRWGHEPYRGGHRVWFELGVDASTAAAEPGEEMLPAIAARLRSLLEGTDDVVREDVGGTPLRRARVVRWLAALRDGRPARRTRN
ncbi:hypothetical protein [Actinomycetospora soli]|uniref:hypothetical protein n=1 Tax=Actinomycetospora soli TaxID=2893887 RepID=UPI001E2AF65D|nr:hypothetical protein [Actinomycetospora soli]MCD2187327.1 hypothetical protein [Actinomycetospora soli]